MSELFSVDGLLVRKLTRRDTHALQGLLDRNADHFIEEDGRPPPSDMAEEMLGAALPPHVPYSEIFLAGAFNSAGDLKGQVVVIRDVRAKTIWALVLGLLDQDIRHTGVAEQLYAALESWMYSHGAKWVQIQLDETNTTAIQFCNRWGFQLAKTGQRTNASCSVVTARMMVKSLAGGTLKDYLSLLPHNKPHSSSAT